MTDRVTHRSRARLDLLEQFIYLAEEASAETALRYFAAVDETCLQLVEFPHSGIPYVSSVQRLEGMRRLPVRGFDHYWIFYVPRPGGIDIIRVLHGARDIDNIFAEEESA